MTIAILSPHLDDAVLSCWHVLRAAQPVAVINVFAGAPPANSAPGHWDRITDARDPAERVRERRAEDRAALALVDRVPVNLELLDDQHRPGTPRLDDVFEAILPAIGDVDELYAPAALCDHADHSILRDLAVGLAAQGARVHLYADLPHAIPEGWPAWLGNGGPPGDASWLVALANAGVADACLTPRVHALDAAERAAKLAVVELYRTQAAAIQSLSTLPLTDERTWRYEVTWALS